MRIGVVLPISQDEGMAAAPAYPEIRAVALAAEAAGFDSLWIYDHLLFRFDGETTGTHEAWTVLSAIAEATTRVQLGTIVMCTSFRNPALLAKMAATLDHVSEGRLILGVGCGWHDPEYEAFGYPTDHKVGRFEEAVSVIHALIREGRADLDGRWTQVRDAVLMPPARPDIPILIAAKRPRMLELTARYANAWNLAWFGRPNERLATVRADLLAACVAVGRDPATLDITVGINVRYPDLAIEGFPVGTEGEALSGSIDEVAAGLAAYAELGVAHVIANVEPATPDAIERFATAMERVRTD